MDASGRFGSLVAKADTSDKPLGALACPSLVAAKLGTKGPLRPLQTGITLATLVAHDQENLREAVRQAQFATAVPATQCRQWWQTRPGMASSIAPAHSVNPPWNIAYKPCRAKRRISWRTKHSGSRNQLEPSPGTKGRSGGVHGGPILAAGFRSHSPNWSNAARNPGSTAKRK